MAGRIEVAVRPSFGRNIQVMNTDKKTLLLLLFALAVVTMTAMAALRSRNQQPAAHHQQQKAEADDSHWPIADYDAPEPDDPKKREKRQRKNGRGAKSIGVFNTPPNGSSANLVNDWEVGLPLLPAERSNVVVTGEVLDAEAYLSADKISIFSEFTVRISEVFKRDNFSQVVPSNSIIIEREGGRVRYPNGRMVRYEVSGQEMPRVGRRYLFFLKRVEEEQPFHLITGYELRTGRVYPLDKFEKFKAFTNLDEAGFLRQVRDVIANSVQTTPEKGM